MKKVTLVFLVAIVAFAGAAPASAGPHSSYDLTLPAIELRPGMTADLHVMVFVNEPHPCSGNVALAVHGMFHTAATWKPLVDALFEDNPAGRKMCAVVALDMPGRGGTVVHGLPWFGAVTLDDYVTAILGALDSLKTFNIRPDTVFAHSLGGLMVQVMQQRLIDQGTDLRTAYGVKDVVLLASGTPRQVPSYAIDSGMLNQIVGSLGIIDPVTGTAGIPDSAWSWLFFAPDVATPWLVVPGAPTPADVAARHYNAVEPLGFLATVMNRPGVAAAVFAASHRTALIVVGYDHDPVLLPSEARALYAYLTGDAPTDRLVLVSASDAVHDTHISNPILVLQSIAAVVRLP